MLGYSKRSVINWESDAADPPVSALSKLWNILDIDPTWIILGIGKAKRTEARPVDWKRLDRVERDVARACFDIGIELSPEQRNSLVRALFDDGPEEEEANKKKMRLILRGLIKEREL